ncbi:MAG: HEPN domain-containing protein [Candidatus Hydrogenedentota bacterium]
MNNNQELFKRWFASSKDDLDAANWMMEGGFYHNACFFSQQCIEKALKAYLYLQGERNIWGHSTYLVALSCCNYNDNFSTFFEDFKKIDRFYIPTRYPNGIPAGTPRENYIKSDSLYAISIAEKLIQFINSIITDANSVKR